MAEVVSSETKPICPYCEKEIDTVGGVIRKLDNAAHSGPLVQGIWVYFCLNCKRVLVWGVHTLLSKIFCVDDAVCGELNSV